MSGRRLAGFCEVHGRAGAAARAALRLLALAGAGLVDGDGDFGGVKQPHPGIEELPTSNHVLRILYHLRSS